MNRFSSTYLKLVEEGAHIARTIFIILIKTIFRTFWTVSKTKVTTKVKWAVFGAVVSDWQYCYRPILRHSRASVIDLFIFFAKVYANNIHLLRPWYWAACENVISNRLDSSLYCEKCNNKDSLTTSDRRERCYTLKILLHIFCKDRESSVFVNK